MRDLDHEEWLEGENARKAAKKRAKKPSLRPKADAKKPSGNEDEDFLIRSWVID